MPAHRYTLRVMPIPANSVKVVLQGHLSTTEIFETGFWLKDVPLADDGEASVLAAGMYAGMNSTGATGIGKWQSLLNNVSGFDKITVYGYNGGSTAHVVGTNPAVWAGTGGSLGPFQACMVVTLNTGLAGRRNRGRMYLPANGLSYGSTGFFGSTTYQDAADGAAVIFNEINSSYDSNQVCVVSQTAGVSNLVTEVVCDNRPDIQRRRADKLSTATRESVLLS